MSARAPFAIMLPILVVLLCSPGVHCAYCNGKPSPDAQPNKNPIQTSQPVFVRKVLNASLYQAGEGEDSISVVHLWGNPYQKGFAHGTLMKDKMNEFYPRTFAFFESQFVETINQTVPWIPKSAADWVARVGLDVALDLTFDLMFPFIPKHFTEEMKGIADATGVDYKMIRRIHMIGELTQGHCSMFGAWGNATVGGHVLQLRALDWDITGPFQDFPQVTIYHEEEGSNSNSFANVGWTGWIGSISGMSSAATAISEIGVTFPDSSFGKQSRIGVPFVFLLRDILNFEKSLPSIRERVTSARRTCDLILGFGDGKIKAEDNEAPFNSVQYSHSVANFMDDKNLKPVNDSWHRRIPNVVYHGMDWLCPGYSVVLQNKLEEHRTSLTPELVINDVISIVQTGDLHAVVYDLTEMVLQCIDLILVVATKICKILSCNEGHRRRLFKFRNSMIHNDGDDDHDYRLDLGTMPHLWCENSIRQCMLPMLAEAKKLGRKRPTIALSPDST